MRIVRYEEAGRVLVGVLDGETVRDVGPEDELDGWVARASSLEAGGAERRLQSVALLPPVRARQIVCVGLNYRDHAQEQHRALPQVPLLFAKLPSAAAGPRDDIVLPGDELRVDYEAELGVVVGRTARRVGPGEALDHVAGYVAFNDVSSRTAQFGDGQWTRGKSCDTFAPFGPALVTRDEVPDPHDLPVRAWVNGHLRQDSSTSQLVFGVDELLAYCSRWFTLEPGDVLATGTPAGVGMAMDPPRFLAPGDLVEVEIGGVGRLENRVVAPAG